VHPSLLPAPTTTARRAILELTSDAAGTGGDTLDPALLTEIAAGLALAVAHDASVAADGSPELLLRTSRYAAWRLVWPVAAAWDCDERGPGVLHVVRGELVEHWRDLLHVEQDQRVVRAGDVIALGGALSTHVENRGTTPAVVVHVTSPPVAAQPCREQLLLVS
jgi:hypothetical protein